MLKDNILLKITIITCLCLVLLIPTKMIHNIIEERNANNNKFEQEFSSKWGAPQTVFSPLLKVGNKLLSPDENNYTIHIETNVRERGLFKVEVYLADIIVKGNIISYDAENNDVQLIVPILDITSVTSGNIKAQWNKVDLNSINLQTATYLELQPSNFSSQTSGFLVIPISSTDLKNENEFSITYKLEGHSSIILSSVAKSTSIHLSSTSENIGFMGDRLPNSYILVKDQTTVEWNYFNPTYEKYIDVQNPEQNAISFGLNYRQGMNLYQKVIRASKYSILFIGLTFLVFFFVEILLKKSIHPIQYLLVGFALLLFYVLLLSFAEQIGFLYAYLVSGLATIILISLYTKSITKDRKTSFFMALFLVCLYLYLYVVVLQDQIALLLGSIGLFIILSSIMYITRNFNWGQTIRKKD